MSFAVHSVAEADHVLDNPNQYSKEVVVNAEAVYEQFLEETILTVLLWSGLWGSISILLDHYLKRFQTKFIVYVIITIIAFTLLVGRGHIPLPSTKST
jgi:hypothetical protein